MADELKPQIEELGKNVGLVVTKSGELEADLKKSQAELQSTKEELESVKKEASVTKDEVTKMREAQNELIKERQKGIQADIDRNPITMEDALAKALDENEENLVKMVKQDKTRQLQWGFDLTPNTVSKAVGDMAIANYTGGTRGLTALRPGIITPPNRKVHVRDILSVGNIGPGTEYVFMKENGAGEGAIAAVAEGATKPQIDMDLIESSVKIETIAGWLRVTRKAMNNIQGFRSWIQSRLPEKLLLVEDNLLLNGDGVTPNIKGLQVAGNFTAASGSATIDVEQLIQAISQLEELGREATGIVVRPSDYYNILLNKASTSGEYDLPSITTVDSNGTMRILGIPVVRTVAQTVDKFLVGDFQMGAQLLIQEGIRVEFFEQDGTNVRENKVTIRIEETIAFPVYGSDFFVFGDFGNVA